MTITKKLAELGIELPPPPKAVGSYVPSVTSGKLLFVSGQLPFADGKLLYKGHVGKDVTVEQAGEAMRVAAINSLAIAGDAAGGLDNISRVLKVVGYVACAPDFEGQPTVTNSASDLFVEIFGEAGRHARAAVGVAALPLGTPVELEVTYELK